jgi:serine/threonine-protein phosphatase 2B regulatory subunit
LCLSEHMGADLSDLRPEDIQEIQQVSYFTTKEIKRLYNRFKRLDKDNSGTITTEEMLSIPELAMNPLAVRVISLFTTYDEHINFKQFIQTLNVFSPKAPLEEKIKMAFRVYDTKGDGIITKDEIVELLKLMVGNNLTNEQIDLIVQKTMVEYDLDKDGKISEDEFFKMMEKEDIGNKMTIRFEKKYF